MNWKLLLSIFRNWLKARLIEKTTWTGLIGALATAAGYAFAPGQADAIATVVAGIATAVLIGMPSKGDAQ
jgi:heme O synthase-like polyprenyltransferase